MIANNSFDRFIVYAQSWDGAPRAVGIISSDGRRHAACPEQGIPDRIIKKLVAIEDRRFYIHAGIDLKAIARAFFSNVKAGKIVQGGSTITQQLARNLFQDNSVSVYRKLREIVYALRLEWRYSKEEILYQYFNSVFWGKNIYGARGASLTYFGKELDQLDWYEENTLLALLRGPNFYLKRPAELVKRVATVQDTLKHNLPLEVLPVTSFQQKKPTLGFNDLQVFKKESIEYILSESDTVNFSIYTTLNEELQRYVGGRVSASKIPISVIVIMKQRIVSIASTHGSNHPFLYRSNVGSTLKPLLYWILRKSGLDRETTISVQNNNPFQWRVRDMPRSDLELTLGEALKYSHNNVFVNASVSVGIENVLEEIGKHLSVKETLPPSAILGATPSGISLYQLTRFYHNFFSDSSDVIKAECREILKEVMTERLGLENRNGYLKTGTTNNYDQRFAIAGNDQITIGFLTEGYRDLSESDYEKDTDYLHVVKTFIEDILIRLHHDLSI